MKTIAALLITGSLLILLTGCTAHKHNKAGDAAASTGDMRGALFHYEQAMVHKESLARSERFMVKLATAESRVAYDDALKLRASGDYEQAIDKLRFSIDRDPAYQAPLELLPAVLVQASDVRYVRAVQAADSGDLGKARVHLDRSLEQDPRNEQSEFALASLSPQRLDETVPGMIAYRQGMSLSAERRWPEAEVQLNKAVTQAPGLLSARSSLHDARLQLTRSRQFTKEGAAHVEDRSMGPAMNVLTLAIDIWPFNEDAKSLYTRAKKERDNANEKLAAASNLAGKRQWEEAIAVTQSGLTIDRSHAGLQKALEQFSGLAAVDYAEQGQSLLTKKQLLEAQRKFTRAIKLDKGLKPALYGLRDADNKLAQARRLMSLGQGHIDMLQMADAIEILSQSLEVWPFNEKGKALLAHATAQQDRAGVQTAASINSAKAGAWDDAIKSANEAMTIDASYDGLAALREGLALRAAADYTEQADKHLKAKALDDAQADYAKALTYVARHEPALSGIASVYQTKGDTMEAKGLLGAALLYYSVGESYQPKHAVGKDLKLMAATVRARIGMGLTVATDPGNGGAVGPDQIGDALIGGLGPYRSSGLSIGGKAAPYQLNVIIGEAKIAERRIASVARTHHYTTSELRHNDEYDRVLRRLNHEETLYRNCKTEHDHLARERDQAHRHAKSKHPGPAPRKPTPPPSKKSIGPKEDVTRQQQEQYKRDQQRYQRELRDYNRRQNAYKSAHAHVTRLDSKCSSLSRALSKQDRVVRDWRRTLSRTPHEIRVRVDRTWPYTIETHEKTGRLAVTSELIDTATGKVIDRVDHSAQFTAKDDLRLNANTDVGLRRDRLSLPSDTSVRKSLTRDLADAASPWAVEIAVQHRLNQIYEQATALLKANKPDQALEARVDAALLLQLVDRAGSAKQIDELAKVHAK